MHTEKRVIAISTVVVAVMLAVIWWKCPICFQNNDDRTLMYFTAGYMTGHKEIGSVFGGFLWYGLIAFFYKIYDGIAWYTVLQLAAIAVSLICICSAYMKAAKKQWYLGIVTFAIILITIMFHFVTALQYTVSAGIIGAAAVCLYYLSLKEDDVYNIWIVLSAVALVLSYEMRKQMGFVALSGLCIVAFTHFWSNRKRVIKTGIALILLFAAAFVSNTVYENITGVADFNKYYKSAGTWNDYPHLSYEGNEDVYEAVGWDDTLFDLAEDWYFMDENVTIENFDKLNETYGDGGVTFNDRVQKAKDIIKSNMMSNIQTGMLIFVIFVGNILVIIKKKADKRLACADLLTAMFIVASAYFLLKGRFPLRVYQALIYVYLIPAVMMLLDALADMEQLPFKLAYPVLLAIMPFLLCNKFPEANVVKYTYAVCNDVNRAKDISQAKSLDRYAIANHKNFYVYDFDLSLPVDPFLTYTDVMPNNLALWGGWQYNTPEYWNQLEENDFSDGFYSKDFLQDNVCFCTRELPEKFVNYITKRHPGAEFKQVDECDGIKIYSIRE
ncbi:hypothetical protein SAMN02910298_01922 [Pseudobutyrivibrio sp. YE44]|uniref:hypothetical protein n=1 Tax=Pseudobutyrivibrio sp. YE44 TaxID=1520802 RepID=UPI000883CEF0|nr:hypothetical protein [Pseudobutyrivibrio sp. YE44]SDB38967.1 hypothetical protein SAMN02910298_01922 [Pseudobutyrivibrio sp. YE44]